MAACKKHMQRSSLLSFCDAGIGQILGYKGGDRFSSPLLSGPGTGTAGPIWEYKGFPQL